MALRGVARVNIDWVGNPEGIIIGTYDGKTNIGGFSVALVGDKVKPHGNDQHEHATLITGSSKVFIEGRAVVRLGDFADCGDTVQSCSNKFFII